jgi:chaperonin GroEL
MMTGGVVNICVGGHTEFEMKERKDRVIDALAAVKAAIAMGIVPGGGSAFLHLQEKLL